jgi:acyl-lipid omega-3 desaturase
MVMTSNACMLGMAALLGGLTWQLGALAMFKLYFVPYWVNVVWLDVVTYLHHHASSDPEEKMPWYRCAAALLRPV